MRHNLFFLIVLASLLLLVRDRAAIGDEVKKPGLTLQQANAEILVMQDRGFGVKQVDVNSGGKDVKYSIIFDDGYDPNRITVHYGLNHAGYGKLVKGMNQRGGVLLTQLKGYIVNGHVLFLVVTRITGPPGTPVNAGGFIDVPAPQFGNLIDREKKKGGRIVDHSSYVAPNKLTYHTVLFHPR